MTPHRPPNGRGCEVQRRRRELTTVAASTLVAALLFVAVIGVTVGLGLGVGAAAAAGGTNHTSCTTISTEGLHVLTSDVTTDNDESCIEITASNVTFDGNGHTVDGIDEDSPSQGVLVTGTDVTNVTVRNVNLTRWDAAVRIQDADGIAVRNATLVGNDGEGVRAVDSANVTVADTNASNNKWGVSLDNVSDATLSNVTATGTGQYGLEAVKSPNVTASGVDASGSGGTGIFLVDSPNSSVADTTVSANGDTGIEFKRSGNATLRNVTATGSGGVGLVLDQSVNGTIRNVTVTGGDWGIYFTPGSTDNVVTNSTVADNAGPAVFMDSWSGDAPTNRFENLTIGDSTAPNTTLSFTGRAVVVDQVLSPPEDPPGWVSASRYLNVTGIVESSYLNLTLDYDDGAVSVDESSLAFSMTDDAGWSELAGSTVDPAANELSANVTSVPVSSSYPVSNWSVLGAFAGGGRLVTDCRVIDSSGSYYLPNDVTSAGTGDCIEITASNVTFDGRNHTVEWSGSDPRNDSGTGILVTGTNVTVRNVTARRFNTGVKFDGVSDGAIRAVDATDNGYAGIHLSGSSNNAVENNTATDNYYPGIYVTSSSSNTFADNTVSGNYAGFWLTGSSDNDLTDDDAAGNDIGVMAVGGSSGNTITGMDASDSSTYSYYADGGSTNAVTSMNLGNSTAANTTLSFVAHDVGVVAAASPPATPVGLETSGRYFYAKDVSGDAFLDVTIPYDEADLALPESSLSLYDGSGGAWTEVTGASVDAAANEVAANFTPNGTFGAFASSPGAVTGCQVIDAAGAYEIVDNVSSDDASNCIEITASDVTLDGTNHTVDAGPGGYGVRVTDSVSNVTVRNLTVTNGDHGLSDGASTDGVTFRNVTVTDAGGTAVLLKGTNVTMRGSTVEGAGVRGIRITSTTETTVADTVVRNADEDGVYTGGDARLTNVTVTDAGGIGVEVGTGTSASLVLRNSTINGSNNAGISADRSTGDVRVVDTVVGDNDETGVALNFESGSNVTVENGVIVGNGKEASDPESGVRIVTNGDVTLRNNVARDNAGSGFNVDIESDDAVVAFHDNVARDNGRFGIDLDFGAKNVSFEGDAVSGNGEVGFELKSPATATNVSLDGTEISFVADDEGSVVDATLSAADSTPAPPADTTVRSGFVRATLSNEDPGTLDLTLPYDETDAPEEFVSLWRYDGGTWTDLDGGRDAAANAVSTTDVSSSATFVALSDPPAEYFEPTVDGTNSPVESGVSVTVTAGVENFGTAAAAQTVTLTANGTVVDSQSLSLGPGASDSVTLDWSTAGVAVGNHTLVVATENATTARTVTVRATEEDGFGGGGGGGGGNPTASVAVPSRTDTGVAVEVINARPGTPARTTLPSASAGGVTYDGLSISFAESAGDFEIEFTPLETKPDDVPEAEVDSTVAYFQVEGGPDDATVDSATISFSLADGALPAGTDPADVTVLRRHDGGWQRLETERVGDGYRATMPGFSTFAVVVDRQETTTDEPEDDGTTTTPTTDDSGTTETTDGEATTDDETTTPAGTTTGTGDGGGPGLVALLALLVVLAAVAALVVRRRR